MGPRISRLDQDGVAAVARNGSPRRSSDEERRKSAEEKVNGHAHAHREDNPKFDIPHHLKGIPRLEVQHYLMRFLYQGNFSSPIQETLNAGNARVLDLGCGAGTWAIEVAKEFPSAQVIGVDITNFFPSDVTTPNVKFILHNFQERKRLPFDDNAFDFVHMRFLLADVKEEDYQNTLIPELVRVTKPNGWIELLEFDVQHYSEGPVIRRLTNSLSKHLQSKGYNPKISEKLPHYLKQTNNVDKILQFDKAIPLGHWAGRVGDLAIEDLSILFLDSKELPQSMGVTDEEYQNLVSEYKEEVEERRTFFRTHRFFTKKISKINPEKS
ncbi:1826_t:CDS:2 [Ambispora gerdemannii]|uniref:1826_t:CDS:1 n=1 Tax=Ambispora gerdemannii TaxID=144530 RepID=A0A9N9FRL7_9GLOM|nr:1826_t:CDS:2 [Ambispora gerdemannii]